MRRTVSKMGNSSLVMTLPSKWAKEHNIKQGDELNVELFEKGLTVSLTNIRRKKRILNIDVSTLTKRTILNILNNAYRSGYVKINLKFKDEKQLSYITQTVKNKLLGFEVVEEKKDSCVIQNIAEPSHEQLNTIIRKIFLLTKQVGELILEDMNSNSFENLPRLEQTKTTVDNLTNFARRVILSISFGGKERSYFLWSIISKLSLIHHSYFYFYKHITERKSTLERTKTIANIINRINKIFELLYKAFYKKNYDNLDKIDINKKTIHEEIFSLLSKNNQSLCYFFELTRNIQMCSVALFGYYLGEEPP